MRNVFVSGESGMLGTAICEIINELPQFKLINSEIKATYNNSFHSFMGKKIKNDEVDILDSENISSLKKLLGKDSLIIHCAAYVNTDKCEDFSYEAVMSNVIGTQNLVSVSQSTLCDFINFSTTAVFDPDVYMEAGGIFTESAKIHPKTIYGATKYACELAVKQGVKDCITIKPVFVFGNFPQDNSSNIVKIFKHALQVTEEKIPITLDPAILKNYMHVSQFKAMMKIIIENDRFEGQNYILSRDPEQAKTWASWLHIMCSVSGLHLQNYIECQPSKDYLRQHLGYSKNFKQEFPNANCHSNDYDDMHSFIRQSFESVQKFVTEN